MNFDLLDDSDSPSAVAYSKQSTIIVAILVVICVLLMVQTFFWIGIVIKTQNAIDRIEQTIEQKYNRIEKKVENYVERFDTALSNFNLTQIIAPVVDPIKDSVDIFGELVVKTLWEIMLCTCEKNKNENNAF